MIAAGATDFVQPSDRQDRRHHQALADRDRSREGRRHLRAARVLLRAGLSRDAARIAAKERDGAAGAPVRRCRASSPYAKTVPDVNGAVDVPDRPGLGADPEEDIDRALPGVTARALANGRRTPMITMNRRALDDGSGRHLDRRVLGVTPAVAQAYPQRPVRIIVPYAPGGGTDVFSRLLAAQMEREFGQTVDHRQSRRRRPARSARRRWRTPRPTATRSAWWTAPSSPIPA